jgi:MFS superfamily sulfate permease-like transporter
VQGGTLGTLAVLAVPLSLGLLAFAPLGVAAPGVGLQATLITTAFGGLLYALLGRAALPAAGPSSATALILAALVLQLVQGGIELARVVALCAVAVALSGLVQVVLAMLGLARLARLVPRPVLAGFMNGVALLILLGQLPLMLGHWPGTAVDTTLFAQAQLPALALAAFTVAGIVLLRHIGVRAPAALCLLLLGTAVHAWVHLRWPTLAVGPRIDVAALPWPDTLALAPVLSARGLSLLQAQDAAVLATALVLALVGALESLLSLQALDEQMTTRHDPRHELLSLGLCNLACGLLGGLPVVVLRARAVAILQAGGWGAMAAATGSLAMLLLFVVGAPLLALLPLPVLGGIMVTVAVGLVDRWSGRLLLHWWRGNGSADLRSALVVMALVCGVTLWQGFAVGVAFGVVLSMAIFIARMNRSLLRSRLSAAARPSRRVYPRAVEARLQPLRAQVHLWELEGALFFGNADRLVEAADGLGADTRAVVLDLHRVNAIDETGAAALNTLGASLQQRQVPVWLAGVDPGSAPERALQAYAVVLPRMPDTDRAVEAAERLLLGADVDDVLAETPLAQSDLMLGMEAPAQALVMACMTPHRLEAGGTLFRRGDPADGLYVVERGSIEVVVHDGAVSQRFLSVSSGMMLGETAMLDGGTRSADAVAERPALLHHLSSSSLDRLAREHPAVAAHIHRNMAVHLSARLRSASAAWWASEHGAHPRQHLGPAR